MQVELNKLQQRLGEPIVQKGTRHGFLYIVTSGSAWLVKPVRDTKRALWWEQADPLIRNRGFRAMPDFFVWQDEWLVMRYISGRTVQYGNFWDLLQSVKMLARFHAASEAIPKNKSGHSGSTLPERLVHRYEQYSRLHSRLQYFPGLLSVSDEFRQLGERALNRIEKTALRDLTRSDVERGTVAHRDLASHNILISPEGKTWLIDFETADLDVQLGDLWQMAGRALVEWHWNPNIYESILHTYETIRPLSTIERLTLQQLFAFPNDFYREVLGLLKRRSGFAEHKVIPYLQMMIRDRSRWYAFLQHLGVAW